MLPVTSASSVAVAPYLEYVNYANPAGGPRIPIVNYVYNQAALDFYKAQIDLTPGLPSASQVRRAPPTAVEVMRLFASGPP